MSSSQILGHDGEQDGRVGQWTLYGVQLRRIDLLIWFGKNRFL